MDQLNKKPTFLENVDMMLNDTINRINIDPNIAKILKVCRSVIQVKFPVKINGIENFSDNSFPYSVRLMDSGVGNFFPFTSLKVPAPGTKMYAGFL